VLVASALQDVAGPSVTHPVSVTGAAAAFHLVGDV
jgi:hypothetical protein